MEENTEIIRQRLFKTENYLGDFNPNKPGGYDQLDQVSLFGAVWESKIDDNVSAPATWDGGDIITPNTQDWKQVSGDYEAWLLNKDKPATTGTTGDHPYNGMGRVVLKKNMVNVGTEADPEYVNTLTQDMFYKGEAGSRVPNANTVFVIKYDFVLGEDITIPANCVLEFDGGSISASGSNDTIIGNNTGIQAGLVKIFNTNVTLAGSWNVAKVYPEWFGAKSDGVTDNASSIQKTIDSFKKSTICFTNGVYGIASSIQTEFLNRQSIEIDSDAEIKALADMTEMILFGHSDADIEQVISDLGLSARTDLGGVSVYGGGKINANNHAAYGLHVMTAANYSVRNIVIENAKSIHLYLGDGWVNYEGVFESIKINTNIPVNESVGIYNKSADSIFTDIIMYGCKTGFRTINDAAVCVNIHTCTHTSNIEGSVGFFDSNGASTYTNCYADTYEKGFVLKGTGYQLTNLFLYYFSTDFQNPVIGIDLSEAPDDVKLSLSGAVVLNQISSFTNSFLFVKCKNNSQFGKLFENLVFDGVKISSFNSQDPMRYLYNRKVNKDRYVPCGYEVGKDKYVLLGHLFTSTSNIRKININIASYANVYSDTDVEFLFQISSGSIGTNKEKCISKINSVGPVYLGTPSSVTISSVDNIVSIPVYAKWNSSIDGFIKLKFQSSDVRDVFIPDGTIENNEPSYQKKIEVLKASGSTRPSTSVVSVGTCFFDTSLSPARPIWYDGNGSTGWVDATGTAV